MLNDATPEGIETVIATVLTAALWAGGCATTNAIKSARESLDRAKSAGAEAKAPYEYYSAAAYLYQANHEAGEGDKKKRRPRRKRRPKPEAIVARIRTDEAGPAPTTAPATTEDAAS